MSAPTHNWDVRSAGKPPPTRGRIAATLLAVALTVTVASAANHAVKVFSTSQPVPAKAHIASYWIHSSDPAMDETTLRFRECARQIKTALSAHGLFEARDEASADLTVAIEFGVTACPTQYENSYLPVYSDDEDLLTRRASDPADLAARLRAAERGGGLSRLIGYRIVRIPIQTYEKHLSFTASENKPAEEGRPPTTYWHINASIEDSTKNLRGNLPVLAAAVMAEIGHATNGQTTVAVADSHPAIAFIKRGP